MNFKKCLWATLAGFVVMFLLGWLGHQVIIMGLLDSNPTEMIERETPLTLGIAIAYLVMASIMAYMYPKGIEGESVLGNGIRFGALVGVLISLPISLIFYSTIATVDFTRVIAETAWHIIEQGAGGVVIAYIYGMESDDTTEESGGGGDY